MPLFSRSDRPTVDELREIALFAELSDDDLNGVSRLAKKSTATAGTVLIDQGRFGDSFYVLSSGQGLVYINDVYVASVGPNTAVGETALVERRPRNATVIAETDMVVAEFGVAEFNTLLDDYPTARLRIMELLNARLRENVTRDQS